MRRDFYSSFFTGYNVDYTVFGGFFSGDNYTDDYINLNNANTYGGGYIYFPTFLYHRLEQPHGYVGRQLRGDIQSQRHA